MNVKYRGYVLSRYIAYHYPVSLVSDATLNDAPTTIRIRYFSVSNIEKFMKENISEFSSFNNDYLDANDYSQYQANLYLHC